MGVSVTKKNNAGKGGILHLQYEEGAERVIISRAAKRGLADKIFGQIPEQGERVSNGLA